MGEFPFTFARGVGHFPVFDRILKIRSKSSWPSCKIEMAEMNSVSGVKTVLVSFLGRNRPVEYTGDLRSLTSATKEAYQDLLHVNPDLELFFQLRDEAWGGM